MPKSLVEKFEQILAADPESLVFVELAKSLLSDGAAAKAERICRNGLEHHPESILGRVLLGHALLASGQEEEGQLEFERALAVDPDNPYGYNLVAEALIKGKRYPQAIPVLEHALMLQPGDLRLRDWLDRAQSGDDLSEAATFVVSPLAPPLGEEAAASDAQSNLTQVVPPPLPPKRSTPSGVADLLLADLPTIEASKPPIPPKGPTKTEVMRIAQSFEDKLRAQFEEEKKKPQSFARRHWIGLTLIAVLVVGAGAAGLISRITRKRYNEKHAEEFISLARQGLLQDSRASLTGALHQMNELLVVDPHRGTALAVAAQAQAMLCHDFGCTEAERQEADARLAEPNAAADREATRTARYYLSADARTADEVLKVDPQVAGAWDHFVAGTILLQRAQADSANEKAATALQAEALRRFDLGLKLAPAHVPILLAVGENELAHGAASKAAELFELAHQASPGSATAGGGNVGAAVGLVEAHLAQRDAGPEDEKALTQAGAGGPTVIPVNLRERYDFALAKVLAIDGLLPKAVELLSDGEAEHSDQFGAYEGALADCYVYDGQYERAETEAWRALARSPKDPDALAHYGEVLLARDRGRDLLQRVPAVQNNRRLHVLRAQAALQTGNLPLARNEIDATRKENKVPVLAGVLLAEVEAKSGHLPEAKQTLKTATEVPHPPVEAFLALAHLEQQMGDNQAALTNARRAVQTDPLSFEAHCLLGRLLARLGKTEEAMTELNAAIRRNRQHVEALVALGDLDLDAGKASVAKPLVEAALREAPQDEGANMAMARALLALSQQSDAIHAAAKAAKIAPQDPRAHHLLGKIAMAVGDRKLAVKELKQAKKLDKTSDRSIGEDLALAEKNKH